MEPKPKILPYGQAPIVGWTSSTLSLPENNNDKVKFEVPQDPIYGSNESVYSDEDSEDGEENKIPDGGWGWVVVFGSFIISMIADGVSFSFGLLYIEFLNDFKASKSTTSWIGSLFMAVPLLVGPICSALVDRFGCRWMTILGGVLSCLGFFLSAFCHTILGMYITFGILSGLGLGLGYVTAVVSIAYWFDRKRTLATSLGACGTGIGTFVYAPLTQYFIYEYGWRGAVILLGGTMLNMCVCGTLMRDPEWWIEEQGKGSSVGTRSMRGGSSSASVADFPGLEELRKMLKDGNTPEYVMTTLSTSVSKKTDYQGPDAASPSNFHSVISLPTFIREHEKVPLEVLEALSNNRGLYSIMLENYPSLLHCRSVSDHGRIHHIDSPVTMSVQIKPSKNQESNMTPLLRGSHFPPVVRKPVNHFKNIRVHRNSVMYRGAMLNFHKYRLRASSCPNIYRNSMTTIAKEEEYSWKHELMGLLHDMFDFSMFNELHFLFMSISTMLMFTWSFVPYFYIAENMSRHNFDESYASLILSITGIANTVGMLGMGWAGDRPWMNVTKTYAVCLVVTGIFITAMPPLAHSFVATAVISSGFGIFVASNFSFTPTILVELIPLERFSTAYGLILLCQGIGLLVGPPLAAVIFDYTGSWDLSFYVAGVFTIVAGLLMFVIPVTKNRRLFGTGPTEKDRESLA